jgi:hypothetical protein
VDNPSDTPSAKPAEVLVRVCRSICRDLRGCRRSGACGGGHDIFRVFFIGQCLCGNGNGRYHGPNMIFACGSDQSGGNSFCVVTCGADASGYDAGDPGFESPFRPSCLYGGPHQSSRNGCRFFRSGVSEEIGNGARICKGCADFLCGGFCVEL